MQMTAYYTSCFSEIPSMYFV